MAPLAANRIHGVDTETESILPPAQMRTSTATRSPGSQMTSRQHIRTFLVPHGRPNEA